MQFLNHFRLNGYLFSTNGIENTGSIHANCTGFSNEYYSSIFYLYQACCYFLNFELCVGICVGCTFMYHGMYIEVRTI